MNYYMVKLHETDEQDGQSVSVFRPETTHFRCMADDLAHAVEQAQNAYPGAYIFSVEDEDHIILKCGNCDYETLDAQDLDNYSNLWERLEPGDTMPHGDCPKCGAHVFEKEEA